MADKFYKAMILSCNDYDDFCVDSQIFLTLPLAAKICQNVIGAENVYGYVIVEVQDYSWQVVIENVYGCDYTVCEHNGRITVKKGKASYALI